MKQITWLRVIGPILLAISLGACQTTSTLNPDKTASSDTPGSLEETAATGQEFIWGGKILKVENLKSGSEITVLSYPLDSNYRPKSRSDSTGRFIATYSGYLEPIDYAPGKHITVVGNFTGFRDGKVAEAQYTFPLITAEKLELHPHRPKRNIPFSIGVGFQL